MSSGCGDVLSLEDLKTAKKHQLFEAEVITGLLGGVAGGASIDYATNTVTGMVQKTIPAILRDSGFRPASFDFTTGGTLTSNDRDTAVYDPATVTWYSWSGVLPKVVPAGTNPLLDSSWVPRTDPSLRSDLNINATKLYLQFLDALNSGDSFHNYDVNVSSTLFPNVGGAGRLHSFGKKISVPLLTSAIRFNSTSASAIMRDIGLMGIEMVQPIQNPYTGNNHAVVKFNGVKRPFFVGNFGDVDIPVTLGYGYTTVGADAADTTEFGIIALNTFKVGTMGIEILGGARNAIVGNVINGDNVTFQHAYRLSGYQGAPCEGNAVTGNISKGCNHGYSFQKTARRNNVSGFTVKDTRGDAIEFTTIINEVGSVDNNIPRANNIDGIVSGGPKALFLLGGEANKVDLICDEQTGDAITVVAETGGGSARLNTIGGIIRKPGGVGATISTDNNHLDLTVSESVGRAALISGSYNSGRISMYNCASGVSVNGNYNLLFITSRGGLGTDLNIAGSNNIIICNGISTANISGSNNKLYGDVGAVNLTGGTGNDFSSTKGDMVRGKTTLTTDANGYATILHTITGTSYVPTVNVVATDGRYVTIASTNSLGLSVRVFAAGGTPLASTSTNFVWRVERALGL